jgi:short-subunit dehydrogenase
MDYTGKVAWITGASSGIGAALARELAARGAHVVLSGRDEARLAEVAADCAKDGQSTLILPFDVRDDAALADATAKAIAWKGDVDIAFANAGISQRARALNTDMQVYRDIIAVDLTAQIAFSQGLIGHMAARGSGALGFISSIAGKVGVPLRTAYCAAKFAVRGFTEALMTDLAVNAPHIKAAVVMPGHIGTDIATNSRKILGMDGGFVAEAVKKAITAQGGDPSKLTPEEFSAIMDKSGESFRERAPTSAAQAATIILDGVRADRWRILVGEDAQYLDREVRKDPENAYGPEFYEALKRNTAWQI